MTDRNYKCRLRVTDGDKFYNYLRNLVTEERLAEIDSEAKPNESLAERCNPILKSFDQEMVEVDGVYDFIPTTNYGNKSPDIWFLYPVARQELYKYLEGYIEWNPIDTGIYREYFKDGEIYEIYPYNLWPDDIEGLSIPVDILQQIIEWSEETKAAIG